MSTLLYQDEVDVFYRLEKHGWSTLFLYIGDAVHEIGISHIFGEPIVDMIDWCQALAVGEEECTILFNDEPGTIWLSFRRLARHQHVAHVALYDAPGIEHGPYTEGNLIAEIPVLRRQLALQLFLQLEKTALLCQDRHYARDRSIFPYTQFERLVKVMAELFSTR